MNKNGEQMRITPVELEVLRNTFRGNEELLRVLRKLFLPEVDPYAPLGQNFDLWMTVKIEDLTPEQALINIKARNTLINHLDMVLMQIKTLAESKDESVEEVKARLKQDSTK